MFSFLYVVRELRRRLGRTILTALGLAVGVGLVIAIMGVSQGLDDAQDRVLAPLGSVGTDILVTRVVGSTTAASASASPSPSAAVQPRPGPGGGGFFGGGGGGLGRGAAGLNQADAQALLEENSNVTTDLSKLGKPGTTFTRDFFLSATLLSFPDNAVEEVSKLPGVESAVGGLVQLAQHQTGMVPEIVASIQTGGQTFEQTVRPAPLTEAERSGVEACFAREGGQARPSPGASPGSGGGQRGGFGQAFDRCLPARFRELRARFITPIQTLRQVVAPPSTDITNVSYTAAGIDPTHRDVGLVTAEQLVTGRWIAPTATDEVLLNVAYANTKSLQVGAKLPINGTSYAVVGLVRPTLTGSTADVYFPVTTLQKLASKPGRVTQVLVKAEDAESVDAVAAGIKKILPGAEVVTTQALADQVTGSLSDARDLASRLGGALAVIVLVSAFSIAVLLTLSSIGKRVREIGTLRAIGWSKGRVVRQLLGETVLIGLVGGMLGVAVGFGVAQLVESSSPALSATSSGVPGINGSTLSELFGQTTTAAQTTKIAVTAPLHATTLVLGVVFALVGGILAGLAGGWRAARLSPAVALRNLG